jgi:uncharacterized LabA/DUF88 family protein
MMPRNTVLFVDYENAYQRARSVFHRGDPGPDSTNGHFSPQALGESICAVYNERHPLEEPLQLVEVRVYRGEPTNQRPDWQSEVRAQFDVWRKDGVTVRSVPLTYSRESDTWAEKGVDMLLGIELVTKSMAGDFDCAILLSADRDFIPALHYVRDNTEAEIHVAAWGTRQNGGFLSLPNQSPFVHWISKDSYAKVADSTLHPARRAGRASNRRRNRRR